ncbi:MAG: hypothetical protein K8T25_22175, partial [Planctomycetia bacterium]|nr:hypothetical protein [Planctomycetia bacterium]
MNRAIWPPIALLAALMLAIGGYLLAAGKFMPRVHPDTASYVQSPVSSLRGMLESPRMPGYPLLLAAVRQTSLGFAA